MRVLVSGSTGLLGAALTPELTKSGYDVVRLIRSKAKGSSKEMVHWDPANQFIDESALDGIDAVVHLAGENIGAGRWNPEQKRRILESRSIGTRILVEALSKQRQVPKVFISASAVGYYGDRGDELLTEQSTPGTGFLADVCQAWESASDPLNELDVRLVRLRYGVILSRFGGALRKMLLPFRLGVGGIIGNGKQYMSCISLDDAVGVILFALRNSGLRGPVNAVCPTPVTNYEFTKTLGRILRRPTVLPMPAFVARLVLGEMADHLLLASSRAISQVLLDKGYSFHQSTVEDALRATL